MEINKIKIIEIAERLNNLQNEYDYSEFVLALYLQMRYGLETIYSLSTKELEGINDIIDDVDTLFSDYLNEETRDYI